MDFCGSWQQLSDGHLQYLVDLELVNDTLGFAIDAFGDFLRSADAGLSWQHIHREQNTTSTRFTKVAFAEDGIGIIIGFGGTIRRSTDYGETWQPVTWETPDNHSPLHLHSIDYVTPDLFFIAGENGIVLRSADKGQSWESIAPDSSMQWNCIDFVDSLHGFVVGGIDRIIYTDDGAQTWHERPIGIEQGLNAVYTLDDMAAIVVGTHPRTTTFNPVFKTTDAGKTWQGHPSETYGEFFNVNFLDSQTGFVTGVSGSILKTTTQGENWQLVPQRKTGHAMRDIEFSSTGFAFVLGDDGTILKTSIDNLVDVRNDFSSSESKPTGFHLDYPFPNPTSNNLSVSFSLTKTAVVDLTLFNLTGQKIAVLFSERIKAGHHSRSWSLQHLLPSSGIYFVVMSVKQRGSGQAIRKAHKFIFIN